MPRLAADDEFLALIHGRRVLPVKGLHVSVGGIMEIDRGRAHYTIVFRFVSPDVGYFVP